MLSDAGSINTRHSVIESHIKKKIVMENGLINANFIDD